MELLFISRFAKQSIPFEDIKMEFYETIMYESFPVNSPIKVEGYTAQQLNETTHLTVMGAYNYLIYLREDPKMALDNLKKRTYS